jgi:predicted RecA/RadA family phage recombinase
MGKADYVQADSSIDYTPVSAVTAGDVIVIGGRLVGVAKVDIAANTLGALAIEGIFDGAKDSSTFSNGNAVYWDADGNPVSGTAGTGAFTTTASGNTYAGIAIGGAATGVSTVRFTLQSSNQGTQSAAAVTIPLTSLRVHDAMQTNLPGTAANDDMGLITGTPGTDAPTIQGVDFGGTSTDEKAAFEFVLPTEYVAGGAVTVRAFAGMLTAVSDGTATLDVECWKATAAGAVGSDLCATSAQSINSLTFANKDFTITPTGLAAGDRLVIRLSFAGSDSGNLAVMIPEVSQLQVLLDIKG